MMTNRDDQLTLRAAVYRLLATLWAEELTESVVRRLMKPEVSDVWKSLGGQDPEFLIFELDRLAEDYCRLFVGPVGHLVPAQSVWTTGELASETVTSLNEFVAIAGYQSPWSDLLPDHLANELQLMGLILDKSAAETAAVRQTSATALARACLDKHLRWALVFLERVTAVDPNGFYGSLANLTSTFLNHELQDEQIARTRAKTEQSAVE